MKNQCVNSVEMSNNAAPECWESEADGGSGTASPTNGADVTAAKFSTLNVNAVEFVPSFALPPTHTDSSNSDETSQTSPEHVPVLNGNTFFTLITYFIQVYIYRLYCV